MKFHQQHAQHVHRIELQQQLAPVVREVLILQDIRSQQRLFVNHIIEVQPQTDRPQQHKGQLNKEVLLIVDLLRVRQEPIIDHLLLPKEAVRATEHRQLLRQEATVLRQEVLQAIAEAVHHQEVLEVTVAVLLVVVVQVLQEVVLQVEVVVLQVEVDVKIS